jgi:hypothetical protein
MPTDSLTTARASDAPRVALVADAIRDPQVVLAARALTEREGGSLVATAVLVGTGDLRTVGVEAGECIALVEAPVAEAG